MSNINWASQWAGQQVSVKLWREDVLMIVLPGCSGMERRACSSLERNQWCEAPGSQSDNIVRFLHVLGLFCCPGCFCFCSLGSVVVPVTAGDRHTCNTSPSMSICKAAAPAHQCWIVFSCRWYQCLDWMFPVFFGSLLSSVFPCFQGHRVPPERRL